VSHLNAKFLNYARSAFQIYVDADAGSDVVEPGIGGILQPYETLQAAMAFVTSAPAGKYTLNLAPGDYGGAAIVVPSQLNKQVSILGNGAAVSISAVLSYTSTGAISDEFFLIDNVGVQLPINIDLGLAAGVAFILLNNGSYIVNRIDTLPAGPQFIKVSNAFIPYFQTNSFIQFSNCNFVGGPASVISASGIVFMTGTIFSFMNATVDGNLQLQDCLTGGTNLIGTGTLSGDATSLKPIVSSLPGLVYLDDAKDLGFTPTTPANYPVGTDTVQKALDAINALSSEEVVYRTVTVGEAAAKQLALAIPTTDLTKVVLFPVGGVPQEYAVDFDMLNTTDLSWNGLGLDGIIASGDVLLITYPS